MELYGIDLARQIAEIALEKKAYEIKIIDLKTVSDLTDYFVICSGDSDAQLRAISNHIESELKAKYQTHVYDVEGYTNAKWILLDYIDVVVHVFQPDVRLFYGLENLWGDAPYEIYEDR